MSIPGIPPRPAWMDQGLCTQTDPEIFYPEPGRSNHEGKSICRECPVRIDCLDYALEHNEKWGLWGGLSLRERDQLKKDGAA